LQINIILIIFKKEGFTNYPLNDKIFLVLRGKLLKKFSLKNKTGDLFLTFYKKAFLFLSLLFVAASIYADETFPFKLTHYIGDLTASGYCEYWNPGTREKINEKKFTGGGVYNRFATLGIRYKGTVTASTISVTFSDLCKLTGENTLDTTIVCPYRMYIYDAKNSGTLLVQVEDYTGETGNGGATAVLFDQSKKWTSSSPTTQDADVIADFYIIIDDRDAQAATYQGTITTTITWGS